MPRLIPIETPENSSKTKAKQITALLIEQAYHKLSSGAELSASDLKVCLDISKAYGIEEQEKPTNILESLPFDELEENM